jgi:hypothetical protein
MTFRAALGSIASIAVLVGSAGAAQAAATVIDLAPGEHANTTEPTAGGSGGGPCDFQADAPDFNVLITFSFLSGECVPEVHLLVRDGSGTALIDVVTRGDPVYARVPPGEYIVTARHSGRPLVQRFTITEAERSLAHFSWPNETASPPAGAEAAVKARGAP